MNIPVRLVVVEKLISLGFGWIEVSVLDTSFIVPGHERSTLYLPIGQLKEFKKGQEFDLILAPRSASRGATEAEDSDGYLYNGEKNLDPEYLRSKKD